MAEMTPRIRLDKWLFFARITKTRSLAAQLIVDGFVRVDGQRVLQPAKSVGPGQILTIALERQVIVVEILQCGTRRGPFSEASQLYRRVDGQCPAQAAGSSAND